jgi:hypothetical protein
MTKSKDMHFTTEEGSDVPQLKEPEDKGGFVYLLMLLFGRGALLPWNAILTALDFFGEKVSLNQFGSDSNANHLRQILIRFSFV